MSFTSLLVRDVTISEPTSVVDTRGDTVPDPSSMTDTTAEGWLARTSGNEVYEGGRDALVWDAVLSLPLGTAITGRARVTIDAETFIVVGPPYTAHTPRGGHHVVVRLRSVVG